MTVERALSLAVACLAALVCACDGSRTGEDTVASAPAAEPEAEVHPSVEPDPEPEPSAPPARAQLPLHARVTLDVSSSYPGWPASNAVDGSEETSWYSGSNDSVAQGKKPYFQMSFHDPAVVRSVTVLGNRDPAFFNGYAILAGQLDVFDGSGRLIVSVTQESTGDRHDFHFTLPQAAEGVGALRFSSTRDQGNKNFWGDIAITEIIVE